MKWKKKDEKKLLGLQIRTVENADLSAVEEIEMSSFNDPYPRSFMEYLYDENRNTFLVAEKDGRVVGYIIAANEGNIGHIIAIAVRPSEKRKHVGTSLMDKAVELLKESNITEVRLEVRKSNVDAQKFYEKLGFKCDYTINAYYGDEDGFIYVKKL